jgi:hypothetical protein
MRMLRGMGSRLLPCGCLVGLYETGTGRIVTIIDAPHPACADLSHRANAAVKISSPRESATTESAP